MSRACASARFANIHAGCPVPAMQAVQPFFAHPMRTDERLPLATGQHERRADRNASPPFLPFEFLMRIILHKTYRMSGGEPEKETAVFVVAAGCVKRQAQR